MSYTDTNYPDIFMANIENNPVLYSPNAVYNISFAFDKEQS